MSVIFILIACSLLLASGFLGAYLFDSLIYGLLLAMLVGGLFGLVMAYLTTTLKMNQFVIGLALFFSGLGLSTLLFKVVIGVTLQPPIIPTLRDVPLPGLSQLPKQLLCNEGLTSSSSHTQ